MRINVNLSEELIQKIDEKAKSMYISRSAYIATALAEKLQSDDVMNMLPEFTKVMKDAITSQKGQDGQITLSEVSNVQKQDK